MKPISLIDKKFNDSLNLPGSKSITLRDAMLASLTKGQSELLYPADCDDFFQIRAAPIELGITIMHNKPELVLITGNGGHFRAGSLFLHSGLSGTAV
jgi:3-phosphoshikimate 1-carboxyvinyltransferase